MFTKLIKGRSINTLQAGKPEKVTIPDKENLEICKNCELPECKGYCNQLKGTPKKRYL